MTVADQNDRFRRSLGIGSPVPGRTVLTRGVGTLPPADLAQILLDVRTFAAFTPDNDPWKEHDCARLVSAGVTVIWKIDYYDSADLTYGASDPQASYRVLTIMLAEEY
jgi:hypothetical protein